MVISDFWTSKMATGGHFFKNIYKKSSTSDLNNVRTDCWPTTTWYKFSFGQYIYRQVCWERGNIHCVRPIQNGHQRPFCKKKLLKKKLRIDLTWPELLSKVNFGHPKWPTAAILSKISWNGQKCDWKWISDIQNGRRQPFCQKFKKKLNLRINLKWPEMR